jgi:tetratricopeptide (TPR) repeat protein
LDGKPGDELSRKAVRFNALMKSVHILSQVKSHLNQENTEEEFERIRVNVTEAKLLFPEKLSVLLLEADQMQSEGKVEESLILLEKAVAVAEACGDGKSMVDVTLIKASALTSQAFSVLQNPATANNPVEVQKAQQTFRDVDKLYDDALIVDPNAIEVMAQHAQLKSLIMQDFEGAVVLLERALPLARSSDEVQELSQLLVMNQAQAKALEDLMRNRPNGL